MQQDFGSRLRELRRERGMTLRGLADAAELDFTYLSKIENGRAGYFPGADTIRQLAQILGVDALDLLHLAKKVPPELTAVAGTPQGRRFLQRANEIASPKDWDALLDLLERRRSDRLADGEKKGD